MFKAAKFMKESMFNQLVSAIYDFCQQFERNDLMNRLPGME